MSKMKTKLDTSILIYTNKKTGIQYDLMGPEQDLNDVTRYRLVTRDKERTEITVTESTFKRWFKKELYVDMDKYEKRKPRKPGKYISAVRREEVAENCFFEFHPRPNVPYEILTPEKTEEMFPNLTINRKEAKVYCSLFPKGRRAYIRLETGNVGIRHKCVLYELDGFKAYD